MFVLYVKSKQATFTYKKWCVSDYPINHIYITTTSCLFFETRKLKRKLLKISNLINICCQQLVKGLCNFFYLFEYLCSLNQTFVSFSVNWNFCLNHGFIIEWNFLFYLVGIFVRTMVSLLSQTSFLLSWNEAQTRSSTHVIKLNRDLIIESNFRDFSNKLEFLPEPRSFYRIRLPWLFQ